MKKISIVMIVVLTLLICNPKHVNAEGAVFIDGSFSDWSNVYHSNIADSSQYFSQAAIIYDEQYIYIHVVEKPSSPWNTNYPTLNINCDGTSKSIVVVRNDYSGADGTFNISVKNSWYNNISNAEGIVYRANGYNEWEIKIPVYDIFVPNSDQSSDNVRPMEVTSVSASWDTGGSVTLSADYVGEPFPTPSPLPTPDPNVEQPPRPGIIIDGYYDDWESMPMTEVGYDPSRPNRASLLKDDGYIYLFYEVDANGNKTVPLDGISITINNTSYQLYIRFPNEQGATDWSKDVYNLDEGIYTGLSPFTYWPNQTLGEAAVTIAGNNCVELKIDMTRLEETLGLEPGTISGGANISVSLPNVGSQNLDAVGVSTGSYGGILICLGVVLLCIFIHFARENGYLMRNKRM